MKFCGNIYDPTRPNADLSITRHFHETQEEAVRCYKDWLKGKALMAPRATERFTTEELQEMGMVGVYDPQEEESDRG